MYITFTVARFNYEDIAAVLPTPTGIVFEDRSVVVSYQFGQKYIGGRQIMRVGLIKKSIEAMLNNQVSWLNEPLVTSGEVYGIDAFYHDYCKYRTYPKWLWVKHRKQLIPHGMKYAIRLHEKGLFCFETVLGYMYIQNQRIDSKLTKYEKLEKKARWVTAKMHERIDRGDFKKLDSEALKQARANNVLLANKASAVVRQTKAQHRQAEVKRLLDDGMSDVTIIANKLGVTIQTIYRDLKKLKAQK